MDAWRGLDNLHEEELNEIYNFESFVFDFTHEMLDTGETEFNEGKYSIQGDIIPAIDEDVVAEYVAEIEISSDIEVILTLRNKMKDRIIDEIKELATELWAMRNEV